MTSIASPTYSDEIRVLIADDEPALRRAVARMLTGRKMRVQAVEDGAQALEMLAAERFDVALIDLMMPRLGGLDVLEHIRTHHLDMEVVLMTAFGDVETAVRAVQRGAYHFLTKPFRSNDEVALIIEQAAERRSLKARNELLERQLGVNETESGTLVGTSPAMQRTLQEVVKVAATKSTVLILGESGTGKELTARAIHEYSPRKSQPFVPVNCGTIPANLIESELFGHVKGSFTNATSNRVGLFEAAHKGTIFLDEVGELSPQAQVSLLRVLQESEIKRVGANESRKVDVRVLAATHVDLREKIRAGGFREDLFFRLQVVELWLPPLRERKEDIPLLALHLVRRHAHSLGRETPRVSPEAMEILKNQHWRGNVRELANSLERALVYCKEVVLPEHLEFLRLRNIASEMAQSEHSRAPSYNPPEPSQVQPIETLAAPPSDAVSAVNNLLVLPDELLGASYREAKEQALAMFDRIYFSRLKSKTNSNVSVAARMADIDRSNFRRAVRRAGVRWRDDEGGDDSN